MSSKRCRLKWSLWDDDSYHLFPSRAEPHYRFLSPCLYLSSEKLSPFPSDDGWWWWRKLCRWWWMGHDDGCYNGERRLVLCFLLSLGRRSCLVLRIWMLSVLSYITALIYPTGAPPPLPEWPYLVLIMSTSLHTCSCTSADSTLV